VRSVYSIRIFTLAVILPGVSTPALAQEWYTGAARRGQATQQAAEPAPPKVAIDASLSGTTKDETNGTISGTIAPFSNLNESGLRLRVGGSIGSFSYAALTPPPARQIDGRLQSANLMLGYEHVSRSMKIAAFGGLDVRHTQITPNDLNNASVGTKAGFRAGLDIYMQPTDYSMASATFTFSTINAAYYGRLKAGLAISPGVYVGPEFLVIGDDSSNQWRVGAHVTGFKLGAMQFGLSGGYMSQKDLGNGFYGILDTRITF
jgi:hypothetical protein